MEVSNIAILLGLFLVVVTLIVRIIKLKRKFFDKIELLTSIGYILFSYVVGLSIVQMIYLAFLTFKNSLTIEIIYQNKEYVFFAWLVIGLGALASYLSLLIEDKK